MAKAVMLVHGAWHGAWCFDRVVSRCEAAGVDVVAPDLPGHGDDRGPMTDLFGDASRVTGQLDALVADGRADAGVVLLGHSYGGSVITQAGVHSAVSELVYLCAFAVDETESPAQAATDESTGISHEGRPDIGAALVWHDDGTTSIDPDLAVELFYLDCLAGDAAWAIAHLEAQPMLNLGQSPNAVAWRERPSTYVVCTDDQMVHPDLQRILARRCTTSVEWSTGHSPFLSRPELVADLLIGLATT